MIRSQPFCSVAIVYGVSYNLQIKAWIPLGCHYFWRGRIESDGYGYDVVGRE
jgi:hypothetical protein